MRSLLNLKLPNECDKHAWDETNYKSYEIAPYKPSKKVIHGGKYF